MRHRASERPGGLWRYRCASSAFSLAALIGAPAAAAEIPEATHGLAVRVTVNAPCSDSGAFFAELRKHSPRVREALAGEPAAGMDVAIRLDGSRFVGVLAVRELGQSEANREVGGPDCSSVLAGLAFVAAVIVDPEAAGQASLGFAPPARSADIPLTPNAIAAAPAADSFPRRDEAGTAHPFRFTAGAAVEAARGLGPDTALVPRIFLDFAFPRIAGGLDARVSGGRGLTRQVATNLGTAEIDLTDLRLDACVDTWSRAGFEVASCALFDGVLLSGQGTQTESPHGETRLSFELGLALRPRWSVTESIALELVLGASAPLARYRFYFDPDTTAYRLAAIAGFAEFGAGVRFP